MLLPRNTPYSALPPSLVLLCRKDAWSGTEMLKDLAQSRSTTGANTAVMRSGARLVFLHAAVLACAGWFLRATSVVITEPDWCGPQRNRAFY